MMLSSSPNPLSPSPHVAALSNSRSMHPSTPAQPLAAAGSAALPLHDLQPQQMQQQQPLLTSPHKRTLTASNDEQLQPQLLLTPTPAHRAKEDALVSPQQPSTTCTDAFTALSPSRPVASAHQPAVTPARAKLSLAIAAAIPSMPRTLPQQQAQPQQQGISSPLSASILPLEDPSLAGTLHLPLSLLPSSNPTVSATPPAALSHRSPQPHMLPPSYPHSASATHVRTSSKATKASSRAIQSQSQWLSKLAAAAGVPSAQERRAPPVRGGSGSGSAKVATRSKMTANSPHLLGMAPPRISTNSGEHFSPVMLHKRSASVSSTSQSTATPTKASALSLALASSNTLTAASAPSVHALSASCSNSPSSASFANNLGAAAALGSSAPNGTDRFIPTRDQLGAAVTHAQALALEETYGSGNRDGAGKENEGEEEKADDMQRVMRALQRNEFRALLSRSLMPGAGSAESELSSTALLSFASPCGSPSAGPGGRSNSRLGGGDLSPKVLWPSSSACAAGSSTARASAAEHQSQLSATYRSGVSAASVAAGVPGSAAAAASAAGLGLRSNSTPMRSARAAAAAAAASAGVGGLGTSMTSSPGAAALALLSSPARERALVARHASIAPRPFRTLDAPELANDYYLNLLHCSSRNVLAIGLGSMIYLWNGETQAITCLSDESEEAHPPDVTALRWSADGSTLAAGYSSSCVKLWDASGSTSAPVRRMNHHMARVGCLDWNAPCVAGGNMLASGSKDTAIHLCDVRIRSSSSSSRNNHSNASIVHSYTAHREEVCGLSFSADGSQLASGANDNFLCIWNTRVSGESGSIGAAESGASHLKLAHHSAAVKALAWCPWSARTLASGGGLADGHIRFTSSLSGTQMGAVDTKSQVCALAYAPEGSGERELLSAHGAPNHSLILWRCPDMTRITTLTGHSQRVLHLALTPEGSTAISASPDETLRFWKIWNGSTNNRAGTNRANAGGFEAFRSAASGSSPHALRIR